jgi:hypothetical protein
METDERKAAPSKSELLAAYHDRDVGEVYEFRAISDDDSGDEPWSTHLVLWGPKHTLEETGSGVRVQMTRGVPLEVAIEALREIADMLESCRSSDTVPALADISRWFEISR